MARRPPKSLDPAQAMNQKILSDREERLFRREAAESIDLGLNLKETPPASAAELLADEWDKKAFGEPPKTTTRTVYGPDPLVTNCPEFHDRLEKYGIEAVAEAFRDLILDKGEMACPDPIMRKGVKNAIARFGKEATAGAFRDRILRIPSRVVEIELDGAIDPLIANPMRALVDRYCPPGMAVKFLSERCMQVLGKRGYEIVMDEHGDPVKCGTLIMGIIPEAWAERRRQHWAEQSQSQVREQEERYYENAARSAREGGSGFGPLPRGESMTATATEGDESLIGLTRESGISIGRQR